MRIVRSIMKYIFIFIIYLFDVLNANINALHFRMDGVSKYPTKHILVNVTKQQGLSVRVYTSCGNLICSISQRLKPAMLNVQLQLPEKDSRARLFHMIKVSIH
jgi:hypothetical protein